MKKARLIPRIGGHDWQSLEKAKRHLHAIESMFKLAIVPTLNIANSTLVEAKWAIMKRGLCRHRVKHWLNEAQKGYKDVERFIYADMDKDLHASYQEFMDLREENIKELIKSPDPLKIDRNKPIPLFEALKASMANQGEDDIVFKATLELANAMNDIATLMFSRFVEAMRASYGIDVSSALGVANNHKQKKNIENVCDALCKYKNGYGFYKDKFVREAIDIITIRCLDCMKAEEELKEAIDADDTAREINEQNEYYHNLASELSEAHDNGLVADVVVKADVYDNSLSGDCNVPITQRQYDYIRRKPYRFARVRRGVSGERALFRIGVARHKGDAYRLKLQERIAV